MASFVIREFGGAIRDVPSLHLAMSAVGLRPAGPQTGSRASLSAGDATDLSMSPSCSGAFSMSPPTTRKILRDRWGGAAAGPARGLARRRLLPTCPSVPQRGHYWVAEWGRF